MSSTLKTKIASVVLSVTTVVTLSGPIAHGQTVADLQAQIASLLAQITALQAQLSATTGGEAMTGGAKCSFTRSLTVGSKGADAKCLQQYLNSAGYAVAASGPGSAGNETEFFGSLTRAAVASWQAANGVAPAVGYFGPISRAKYDSLAGAMMPGPGPGPAPLPGAAGLSASLALSQPAPSLAPQGAARVPFTRFTLTAGSQDVTVNSVLVRRGGFAEDAAFSGIVLLDENGGQIGLEKTLNSLHEASVGTPWTIPAGTSRTYTIAANTASNLTSYNGQQANFSILSVNTSADVKGTFPLTGASHTLNNSLTIGTVTIERGPLDPNGAKTKEIGTTGYTFSSVKVTAGSAEKVSLKRIRWNQSGSAAPSDLANVVVVVDGTNYPTTVSSDGKYYSANLGNMEIDKGLSKEISIKADIVSGSGRTVAFDLYRTTDFQADGLLYGYGIVPPTNGTGFQAGTPWYDASVVTVAGGTLTVEKAVSVSAQNVAINVASQDLGGFDVDVDGEPVTVQQMVFHFNSSVGTGGSANTADITNITLEGPNGVVAGPVDIVGSDATFTDSVTFPVGKNTYVLRGKLGVDFANNQTVTASTSPGTDWTNSTGDVTGDTVTPSPASVVTGNSMTVKSAAVNLSIATDPVGQNVVRGAQAFTFSKINFDATASGEDVRVTSLKMQLTAATDNSQSALTNCQMFDGGTALNTGSNKVDPANTTTDAVEHTFTLDNHLVVPKGTIKQITFQCNLGGSGAADYQWGFDASPDVAATGLTSGQDVAEGVTVNAGPLMSAVANGTLTVSLDVSSPSYAVRAANTTGNTLGILKFSSTNEDIDLKQLGLQLSGVASNSSADLGTVKIWDGATEVGQITFVNDNATATLSNATVPKDGDLLLTLTADFAEIGTAKPGTQGALVKVDYDGDAADASGNATRGVGKASGVNIYATGADTASQGVRLFRGYPTVAKLDIGDTSVLGGAATRELYRWSVKATNRDVGLYKFTLNMSTSSSPTTSTTSVTDLKVFGYTDSGLSNAVPGFASGGQLNATIVTPAGGDNDILMNHAQGPTDNKLVVPSGSTYYFKATAVVTLLGGPTSASVSTKLLGDSAYPSLAAFMNSAAVVDAGLTADNNFLWSPNATTTSLTTNNDWTNGYQISGLPSDGLDSQGLAK